MSASKAKRRKTKSSNQKVKKFIERWFTPNSKKRAKSLKRYMSSKDVRKTVVSKLGNKLDKKFQIYIADGTYYLPPLKDAKEIIKNSAVDRKTWVKDRFDCDDFAHVLKAHFAEASYKDGNRRAAHCFGVVWGMLPNAHAINWMINEDGVLRFIEPQNDKVYLPKKTDKDIWFMLV